MSGRLFGGKVAKKAKISKSSKANLIFPVSRIYRLLKKGKFTDRVGSNASVYLTAVIQVGILLYFKYTPFVY